MKVDASPSEGAGAHSASSLPGLLWVQIAVTRRTAAPRWRNADWHLVRHHPQGHSFVGATRSAPRPDGRRGPPDMNHQEETRKAQAKYH